MKEKSFLQMQAYDSIKNGILNGELERDSSTPKQNCPQK